MTIQAVVFDIGGVLEITPNTGWREKWAKILNMELGDIVRKLNLKGLNGDLGTCSLDEWTDGLQNITNMTDDQVDHFMNDLWEEYLGSLNTPLVNFIHTLRPQYKTAILSNSFLGAREKEENLYHFNEFMDVMIYSHEVGLAKPDPKIYQLTCDRLGMQPNEIIFVDDYKINITSAKDFGIHAILFQSTKQVIHDIQAHLAQH